MRDPGAHMGICEDGEFIGSLSGGCIENAVVAEAQDVLAALCPRIVRFGSGSSYLDIKLPCGGGLDVLFNPLDDIEFCGKIVEQLSKRAPLSLSLPLDKQLPRLLPYWQPTETKIENRHICVGHWPSPRLVIIGHGAGVLSLAQLAKTMDMDVEVITSDPDLSDLIKTKNIPSRTLKTPQDIEHVHGDSWTAFIFMFHDHDWEAALMVRALGQPHFYIGAMGGKKAHANRLKTLAEFGVEPEQLQTINAPIGLFHSSRDPDTLAVSTIAEVLRTYVSQDFRKL
ncbi:XdhC family protein [Parasphingorhabdus halotolerans]|nr:XdhC family protein [Parasphingorhabdus halotolerans]